MRLLTFIIIFCSFLPTAQVFGTSHAPNQIIIKTRTPLSFEGAGFSKNGTTPGSTKKLNSLHTKLQKHGITLQKRLGGEHNKSIFPLGRNGRPAPYGKDATPLLKNIYLLNVESSDTLENIIRDLEQEEGVLYAEPNLLLSPSAFTPNDTNFNLQPNLNSMNFPDAWPLTLTPGNIIIAIVDTGVNYTHSDLNNNIWTNPGEIANNNIDDDGNGFIDDIRGWDFQNDDKDPRDNCDHGSRVAGIAAAETNNNLGIAGAAFNKGLIMPLAAANGTCKLPVAALAGAIKYAADNGAKIINMSFGDPGISPTLKEAVDYALARKVLMVAAAGNDAKNIDTDPLGPYIPASYPGVLTVSAVDNNGQFAAFSNFGDSVDVAAPGFNILSTTFSGSNYGTDSGTSFSAPQVSGLGALIMSLDASFDGEDAFQIITSGVSPNAQGGKSPLFGLGLADARIALALINPTLLNPSTDPTIFGPNGFLSKVINHPNPFNPDSEDTKIFFYLSKTATVLINIYSMNLDLVKRFQLIDLPQNDHQISWDGKDISGDIVPNGVYVMVLEATAGASTTEKQMHKIAVLR